MQSIVDISTKYDLSKFEQIMLAYDYARYLFQPIFYQSSIGNKNTKTTQFCNEYFKELLADLDINYKNITVEKTIRRNITDMSGKLIEKEFKYPYDRFIIYVKDDKYAINGVYFFDLDVTSTSFSLFAKTDMFFDNYDKINNITEKNIYGGERFSSRFNYAVEQFYDTVAFDSYDAFAESYIEVLNDVSDLVDAKPLNLPLHKDNNQVLTFDDDLLAPSKNHYDLPYSLEKIDDIVNHYDLLFGKEIYAETMLSALLNVYQAEFLSNLKDDAKIDVEDIKYAFIDSDWNFKPKSEYVKYERNIYERYLNKTLNEYHDCCKKIVEKKYQPTEIKEILVVLPEIIKEIKHYDVRLASIKNYINKNNINDIVKQINLSSKPENAKVKQKSIV